MSQCTTLIALYCDNNQLIRLDLPDQVRFAQLDTAQETKSIEVDRQEDWSWYFGLAALIDDSNKIFKIADDNNTVKVENGRIMWNGNSIISVITYTYDTGNE